MRKFYNYKGAIHIHTELSDGTGNINSISLAAKKAGLDFIIITDHNHYDNNEGIFNNVYVIKAQEVSPNRNHYLTFGLNETIAPNEDPNIYINRIRELGGFGFSAHPDEGYTTDHYGNIIPRKNSNHCIPWTDKSIEPDGLEIWNWFSNWADHYCDKNVLSKAYAYFFKHNIVTSPSKITLKWWDELNNKTDKIVPAIGGVDAHALKIKDYIIPLYVFPYETCFKTVTNNIYLSEELSKDFETAKKQIFKAIQNGNNTIFNRHISNIIPNIIVKNSKNIYYPGENIELDRECSLHFVAKKTLNFCLIYNGERVENITSNEHIFHINKRGKYRIEVSFGGKGYLYTNPFNIL